MIKDKINTLLNLDPRSRVLYGNIIASFGLRIFNILIGFILIPLLIHVLTDYQYGIWIALANIINWINYFDIGLGNGLKNKLGEAFAKSNFDLAKEYISTSYIILICISSIVYVLFYVSSYYIDFYTLFNIDPSNLDSLFLLLNILVLGTLFNFVTKIIDNILMAKSKTALTTFKFSLSQLFTLIYIYVLSFYNTQNTLLLSVLGLTLFPVIFNVVFSIFYFSNDFNSIKPSLNSFKRQHINSLFGLGSKFFIIQIGVLVMFQSQTFFILKLLGATDVTQFSVAYKFYTILYMLLSILMVPFWSSIIEAYHKQDMQWIIKKLKEVFVIYILLGVSTTLILVFFGDVLIKFWLGKDFFIEPNLKMTLIIYSLILSGLTIAMNVINGIGKLNIQLILYIICSIVNLPLSYYLTLKYGISGVVIASILLFCIMNLFLWKQVFLLVNGKSYGLWDK